MRRVDLQELTPNCHFNWPPTRQGNKNALVLSRD
jgi:hypothetical protein